jgi:heme/copper-type cytochrome/quinol oxidase subunit 3
MYSKEIRSSLLLLLLGFFLAGSVCGQNPKPNYYNKTVDSVSLEKSNIEKFADIRATSFAFSTAGTILMVTSSFANVKGMTTNERQQLQTGLMVAGIGLNLAAYYTMWRSNKWLKAHAIELTSAGVVKRF